MRRKKELREIQKLEGIYILYSTRPKGTRGGMVAILPNKETFTIEGASNINVPKVLEVNWAFDIPKLNNAGRKIWIGCF